MSRAYQTRESGWQSQTHHPRYHNRPRKLAAVRWADYSLIASSWQVRY